MELSKQEKFNIKKFKKALRIAEIRKEFPYSYREAEKIYNTEALKKEVIKKIREQILSELSHHDKWEQDIFLEDERKFVGDDDERIQWLKRQLDFYKED